MRNLLLAFLSALLSLSVTAQTTTRQKAEAYIEKYSDMAVAEMYRSGVPASITLSQGLLESGYGLSELARASNNHFGIKCHSDWKGERVFFDDDAKGECFRKYPSVADSYADHGDFLRYKPRYAFLFNYQLTDFKSWAHGLKKAGYATDPQYAYKLINIIELYDLSRFDKAAPKAVKDEKGKVVVEAPQVKVPESPAQLEQASRFTGSGRTGTFAVSLHREILQINGIPFIYAREGETYRSVAALYDLFPKELLKFNDDSVDRDLVPGEVVYLHRKARYAVKGLEKHICSDGESLRDIAQKYAITVKSLKKLNGITDEGTYVVQEDATLLLRPEKKR